MQIGIDLGGTKIAAVGLVAGDVMVRKRIATPRGDYETTLTAIAGLVAEIGQPGTIGVGIPGSESRIEGTIRNANSTWLIGRPLRRDLEATLNRPIRLANDADCFALSEAVDGAGSGASPVFGVILGTGVGGGIVIDGNLLHGASGIAGEWGHNPLPWPETGEMPGADCYCGKSGCIETFLSGTGLSAAYRQAGGAPGQPGERIAREARAGAEIAARVLDVYCHRLARALAGVVNILDPEVIVLGGGLSNIDVLYQRVPDLWRNWIFSDRIDTELRANRHGDSSGVRGAAWLWPEKTDHEAGA